MQIQKPAVTLLISALATILTQALPIPVRMISVGALAAPAGAVRQVEGSSRDVARASAANALPYSVYLPMVGSPDAAGSCPGIPGESYATLTMNPPRTDRPAAQHPDLNLALRGYITTTSTLDLVDVGGTADPRAPQLPGLFVDNRTATFLAVFQVYDWDWASDSRGAPIGDPPVTLAALQVTPGERIRVPNSGYNIGTANQVPPPGTAFRSVGATSTGYQVLVLYASRNRITFKYTRDDNVKRGYTLHLEEVCVEPRLLALYEQMDRAGRARLPALMAGQTFGSAIIQGIGVAIRDTGSFMDPRSRKDWWQGR